MVKIKPFYPHIVAVNWQRSGKDLLLNADIYTHFMSGESLFHMLLYCKLHKENYLREVKNVYANCKLDKEVYGDNYYLITSIQDIKDARDGIIYINDMEKWFDSRGFALKTANADLLDLVNNMSKDGLMLRGSAHRYMSIDVKLRDLIHLWLVPEMFLTPGKDWKFLDNYFIVYDVYDAFENFVAKQFLTGLCKYGDLYDTLEKVVPLVVDVEKEKSLLL